MGEKGDVPTLGSNSGPAEFSTKEEIKEAFFKIDQDNTNPSNDTSLGIFKGHEARDIIIAKQGKTNTWAMSCRGDYIYSSQVDVGFHTRAVEEKTWRVGRPSRCFCTQDSY